MTPGLFHALGAMLCFGLGDLVYKQGIAAGTKPHQLLMVQAWIFMPSVALYALITGQLVFTPAMLWGCVAGLFMWSGFYNFAVSLRTGSISVNGPIFRLSFVITAALAILFLHETLTGSKLLGLSFALAAVWLLAGGQGSAAATDQRGALIRVAIATVSVGVGTCIYKLGLHGGATAPSLVAAQALVVILLSTVQARMVDRRIGAAAAAQRYAPRSAILLALGFVFMVEALARGDASRLVPIAQMGLAVSAVAGFAFLGEPYSTRKGLGLCAAVASLASFVAGA